MATNPLNLVEAIGIVAPRYARTRSAVIRVGTVSAALGNGFARVSVGGADVVAAHHTYMRPVAGQVVSLFNDRDMWLIGGVMANVAGSIGPYAVAANSVSLPISGKLSASVVAVFPANRFAVAPIVTNGLYTDSGTAAGGYTVRQWFDYSTSITLGMNLPSAANTNFWIHYIAMQMTATTAGDPAPAGLQAARVADDADATVYTVTCDTEGCGNAGIAIDVIGPADADAIQCTCGAVLARPAG